MSITAEAISEVREKRRQLAEEEKRWADFRRQANPPAWFIALLLLTILGGMLAFVSYISDHPEWVKSIGSRGLLIVPAFVIVPALSFLGLSSRIFKRKETTLLNIIRLEAPTLFEKLKEERLIR